MNVQVGQVWKPNDVRDTDRTLCIDQVGVTHAQCSSTSKKTNRTRTTRVKLSRFGKSGSKGYTLVTDVAVQAQA